VNDKIKTTIKAITIKAILIIFFIENVEFPINWYLVYVFSHPQVYFAAFWTSRDLGSPIVSVLTPLLLAISDDIIVNGGNTKSWRRSDDHEPGWVTECNLPITGDNDQGHVNHKNNQHDNSFVHIHFGKCLENHEISSVISYLPSMYFVNI